MNLQDKVYIIWDNQIDTGIIVAIKWRWSKRWLRKLYVVRVVKESVGVSDILTTAFYGPSSDLRATTAHNLVRVPKAEKEPEK